MKHALLSASSSHRWMNCPPSARLCEHMENKGSEWTAEGTDAHALCEYKLRRMLGMEAEDPTEKLTYYNGEMEECASGYADYVIEIVEAARTVCEPAVLIEQKVDFSEWVPDGFGTADCIVIADGVMHVIDYKHGQGVTVEAEQNPQMMLYALGALRDFDALYDIDTIRMTIYQPRKANISGWEIYANDLYEWADSVLSYKAELAYKGEGEYKAGDWCRFCLAKTTCRKRAEAQLALARYDFRLSPQLSDDEVEEILGKLDDLTAWAQDLKAYALQRALDGHEWRGWKLVEGRSNRKYTDEQKAAEAILAAGYDPFERKLISVNAAQKMLGKARFEEVLMGLVQKPPGKLALVPESDKRPATSRAQQDFKEE